MNPTIISIGGALIASAIGGLVHVSMQLGKMVAELVAISNTLNSMERRVERLEQRP